MCHACMNPSSAEYWHSGETYERLLSFRQGDGRRICSQRYDCGSQHHVFWGVWRALGLFAHLAEDRQQFQKVDSDEVCRTIHQVQGRCIRGTWKGEWMLYWMSQHLFYTPGSLTLIYDDVILELFSYKAVGNQWEKALVQNFWVHKFVTRCSNASVQNIEQEGVGCCWGTSQCLAS